MSLTTKLVAISSLLVFVNIGCVMTLPILTVLGTVGVASNKYLDYTLTKRGLDLKEREIELKEKQFEMKQ